MMSTEATNPNSLISPMYRAPDLNSISVNVLTVLIVVTVIVLLSSAKVSVMLTFREKLI